MYKDLENSQIVLLSTGLQLFTTKWTGFLTRCLKRIILKKRENRLSFVLFAFNWFLTSISSFGCFVFTTEILWKGRGRLPMSMVFFCKYDNDTAGWPRRRVERSTINEHDMLALHLNINVAWWTRKWRFFDELSSGDYCLWIDLHFFFEKRFFHIFVSIVFY